MKTNNEGQLDLFADSAGKNSWFAEICHSLDFSRRPGWPDRFGDQLKLWIDANWDEKITTLSLFSGGGGLDIGFHDVGFESIEMVEIDERYTQTLHKNSETGTRFDGVLVSEIDIREYEIPTDMDVDFIIGGPPCQTFSAAGRRAAGVQGTDDARGTLFEEYVRILDSLQPLGFLFENVYGITGAQGGNAWKEIKEAFREAGYAVLARTLDAADYGVPQHRERTFIIGVRNDKYKHRDHYLFPRPCLGPDSRGQDLFYTSGEAVADLSSPPNFSSLALGGKHGHLLDDIPPGLNYSFYTKKRGYPDPIFAWRSKFSDYLYKADPERPVRTIKAQGGAYTGPFSWESRAFTVKELKRFQTFPDDYEIVGNRSVSIEQIGNSVPPQMARMLATAIASRLFEKPLPFEVDYLRQDDKLNFRSHKRTSSKYYNERTRRRVEEMRAAGRFSESSVVTGDFTWTRHFSPVDFAWKEKKISSSASHEITIKGTLQSDLWRLSVSIIDTDITRDEPITMTVGPSGDGWLLNVDEVEFLLWNDNPLVYTAAWKAFEECIRKNHSLDGLVQLFGYYQYEARGAISLTPLPTSQNEQLWAAIENVLTGDLVGEAFPLRRFAAAWSCDLECAQHLLEQLKREIGYEVRSFFTNPQLPRDHYLIPYPFPTLYPKSVQLHKSLHPGEARA